MGIWTRLSCNDQLLEKHSASETMFRKKEILKFTRQNLLDYPQITSNGFKLCVFSFVGCAQRNDVSSIKIISLVSSNNIFLIMLCLTDIIHEIQHELMSVSSSFSDKNEKIQDDIFSHTNFEFFVNEIIICDIIATKNDLEQYEFNVNEIIHVTIKKCK